MKNNNHIFDNMLKYMAPLAFVISCIALYFSIYTYKLSYVNANERLRFDEKIVIQAVELNLYLCRNNNSLCESSINSAEEQVAKFKENLSSERESLTPEQYKVFQITVLSLEARIAIDKIGGTL